MGPERQRMKISRPRRVRSAATIVAILGLILSLQVLPAKASRARVDLDVCGGRGVISAARLPSRVSPRACELIGRYVQSGTVKLQVPPPGESVGAAAVSIAGESELVITTESDGDVLIDGGESETGSSVAALSTEPCDVHGIVGCLAPCSDGNYNTYSGNPRVKVKQPWFFKAASTPGTLTRKQALTHIKKGTQNVVNGNNDCALPDPVGKTSPYKGKTSKGTRISIAGSGPTRHHDCGPSDSKNVVDFGALISPTLGLACWRSQSTTGPSGPWFIVEADIRLLKSAPWALNPDDPACTTGVDLQGVMTHERGHAFGLAHADAPVAHTQQTMYPSTFPCTSYARTLGLGDHSALAFLY